VSTGARKDTAMLIDLSHKVAIVTGAARGIGLAIADRLAEEGATVSRWDRAWADPGHRGQVVDVTDTASVEAATRQVHDQHGRIDLVVNNAGILRDARVEDQADQDWDAVLGVNLSGVFKVCRAVAPIMKAQRGGRIINAASFAAIVPSIGSASYAASKAGVVYLTRVLAGELGPWGITVNAYAPGMIPSAINHFTQRPAEEQQRLLDTVTLRRWGRAQEVADLICFLASDRASYITGTLIDVSGGKLATQRPEVAYQWPDTPHQQ
jgi:3-oxoacyl-[acyl-carrier protein] reductase